MEEPLRIALCEDSAPEAQALLTILNDCPIPNVCTLFSSGEALLAAWQPRSFDLLLTDIYMEGITGIEAVTRIRETDPDVPVAFVTSSTEHALESYRLSALKYIEKPYGPGEIEDILLLARMKRDTSSVLPIQRYGKGETILFSQILYLEQQIHHVNIFLKDGGEVSIYKKLSSLLPTLERQGFFSPHKSFAVNLAHVCSIDPELRCFVMPNGKNVPIRRESMGKAKRALEAHLFRRTRSGEL